MEKKKIHFLFATLSLICMGIGAWFLVVVNNSFYIYFKIFTVLLFFITALFDSWTLKSLARYALFTGICVIVYMNSKDDLLLYLPAVMVGLRGYSYKRLAKIDWWIKMVCIPSVIILYLLKYINNYDDVTGIVNGVSRIRYSLGYFNPNTLFLGVYFWIIDYIVINDGEIKPKVLAFIVVIGTIFGYLTFSRTGLIMLFLTVFMFLFINRKDLYSHKFCSWIVKYIFPISLIISMSSVILYQRGNVIAKALSAVLTGRIEFASRHLMKYGISIFGQRITLYSGLEARELGVMAINLDVFYVYALIAYGVVFVVFLTYLSIKSQERFINEKKYLYAVILSAICIYCFTEKIFISIESNIWVILLGYGYLEEGREEGRGLINGKC